MPPAARRAAHVARRGVALALSADAADRRRITAKLTATWRPLDTADLDELTAAYARAAYTRGAVAETTALGLRTRSGLIRRVIEVIADRTGSLAWRLALAEVLAGLPDEPERRRASDLLADIVAERGAAVLGERQQLLHAQLLYLRREYERLHEVLPDLERLPIEHLLDLRGDVLNPVNEAPMPGTDRGTWWRSFTRGWRVAGLIEPVLAEEDGRPALDRLGVDTETLARHRDTLALRLRQAGLGELAADPPLVTVVVAVHRPDLWLETAVRSLADQTYPALEILLVDDASGPEFTEVIARAAALDPRVRVVTADHNGGAYRARNLGVRAARGGIVTFHDADDWAHPEKVERQLVALFATPDVVATESLAVRALPDLTRQWLGYGSTRVNKSSLMIRREDLAAVGGFDPARKSGDQEFWERLRALRGAEPSVVQLPLSVVRLRTDSLSRGDFAMGWARSARIGYQSAYRRWHQRLAEAAEPARAGSVESLEAVDLESATDAGRRPYAAPRPWLGQPTDREFDVLVVDDVAEAKDDAEGCSELLASLAARGHSVALLHREDPSRLRRPRRMSRPEVADLVNTGQVVQVHPEEPVHARLVLVRTPSVLVADREPPTDLRTDLVVVLRPEGHRRGHVGLAWTVEAVAGELATWTNAPVLWVPAPFGSNPAVAMHVVEEHLTSLRA